MALVDYVPPTSPFRRYVFYCEWPSRSTAFDLAGDEEDLAGVGWFTLEEALAHPGLLTDGSARDLALFRERLATRPDAARGGASHPRRR